MTLKTIEGTFIAPKGKYALVVGRFNSFVVESLVSGAVDALVRHGVSESDITLIRAPGAFEIPLVAQKVAQRGEYSAIIALGAVIRGGTPHFEYVAGECTKGLAQVSMEFGVPVAFGVLTVDSIEQAIERSGTKAGNKGAEAALSALEMVSLLGALEASESESRYRQPRAAYGNPAKGKTAARRLARSLAMQALYQWHMAGQSINEIEAQFRVDNDFSHVDGAYFREILHGVPAQKSDIDELLILHLDRPLADLDPVELAILRLSSFELRNRLDVPYRVVINEGIELAKVYGATDGHKFVNGVLDKALHRACARLKSKPTRADPAACCGRVRAYPPLLRRRVLCPGRRRSRVGHWRRLRPADLAGR